MKVDSTLHSALPPPPKSEIDSRDADRQQDTSGSTAYQTVDHTSRGGAVEASTARGGEVQTEASQRHSLGFEVNPESHEVTINVVDENGEVIGKVPPEKLQDSMPEIEFAEGMKLSFDIDSSDHTVKITLKDGNGEVVRTVPPEYLTQGSIVNVEI
jgi:uncharacterized FlaG/YvyC family protein